MRLIDADKLGDEILLREWNVRNNKNLYAHAESILWALNVAWREIQVTPTIEAEPVRHGKWIKKFIESAEWNWDELYYECSECTLLSKTVSEFCPHCGTKMDGDKTMEENNKENSQMQEVAAILGLQIREPFKVIEGDGECYEDIFRFDHDGIYWLNTVSSSWLMTTEKYILWELVVGQLKILRLIGEHDGSLQK